MNGFTNQLKSVMLLAVLTVLVVIAGRALGGQAGMMIAFGLALVMNGVSYWYSDKIAIKMTRSYPVSRQESPYLYEIVERLSRRAGLPMPKLYVTPSHQPNAFATGRNPENSAIAVTQGLVQLMTQDELEGVISHELAHIKNRDVLVSTMAAVMAGVITTLADWAQWAMIFGGFGGNNDDEEGSGLAMLPMIILGPLAAMLIQMAVSRSREYMADATGAEIAGNSQGLANALIKLQQGAQRFPMQANPATSHLFIVNPFSGRSLMNLFSTHPPIEERVKKLRNYRV